MRALERLKALKHTPAATSTAAVRDPTQGPDEPSEAFEGSLDVASQWLDRITAFARRPPPAGVNERGWNVMVLGACRFVEQWGEEAARHGWTEADLFSLSKAAPLARLDQRGAAFLIGDKEIVGVTPFAITVRAGGAIQRLGRGRAQVEAWLNDEWQALT